MMQIICMTDRHMNPKGVRHMDVDEKRKHREKKSDKNVLFNQHPLLTSNINSAFICFSTDEHRNNSRSNGWDAIIGK